MVNPYTSLDSRAFWAPSVGQRDAMDIEQLWTPKFPIWRRQQIASFGSCFAQHFGRALMKQGFHWMDAEPMPAALDTKTATAFNYRVFTARTGNIYTVTLLNQWVRWALGEPSPQDEIWEKDGRFYDPFRPNIEPNGFVSHEEMLASRDLTIEAFKTALTDCKVFVFTLGLTESWWNETHGHEYPMCPGTVAGTFDPQEHTFKNQAYPKIYDALRKTVRLIRSVNPKVRILLTVSPVPLTATMSDGHVLPATVYSKSVLRAVVGAFANQRQFVDYFPSYEIIASPPFGGRFFAGNKREVKQVGVDHVMRTFFTCMAAKFPKAVPQSVLDDIAIVKNEEAKQHEHDAKRRTADGDLNNSQNTAGKSADDLVCEEELLAAFASRGTKE